MKILLLLAFIAAAAATAVAFTAGATWAGILSAAAGILVIGALVTRGDR